MLIYPANGNGNGNGNAITRVIVMKSAIWLIPG